MNLFNFFLLIFNFIIEKKIAIYIFTHYTYIYVIKKTICIKNKNCVDKSTLIKITN
jgi:hypothetical protein